jgi:hypothetical protein
VRQTPAMEHAAADQVDVQKSFVNMLQGVVSRNPAVELRAREVDGVITVTLTLRAPQVRAYPAPG